jgi:3-dehydroquinate synthase
MSDMAVVLKVVVPGGSYGVHIGAGLLDTLGELVRPLTAASRCALVTDDVVAPLFGARAAAALRSAGIEPVEIVVPHGEPTKSWARAGELLEGFSESGLGRDGLVVALGGGVVGDLAGFAAATYLRGVPVVQVPTTLLGQVDSAIGGKTAVDLPRGKNLAGAFWQPLAVVADTRCLVSLPDAEWHSGLAEVAKSAALDSEASFARLERDAGALSARESGAVERAVAMAAALKARVVTGDEREAADRECLNLGHTLGHALEHELGYGSITHGAAVAEGLRFAARLAEESAAASHAWTERQERLLDALGLVARRYACDARGLGTAMLSDKKARGGRVRFVLSEAPGRWRVEPIDGEVLASVLEQWCADGSGRQPT